MWSAPTVRMALISALSEKLPLVVIQMLSAKYSGRVLLIFLSKGLSRNMFWVRHSRAGNASPMWPRISLAACPSAGQGGAGVQVEGDVEFAQRFPEWIVRRVVEVAAVVQVCDVGVAVDQQALEAQLGDGATQFPDSVLGFLQGHRREAGVAVGVPGDLPGQEVVLLAGAGSGLGRIGDGLDPGRGQREDCVLDAGRVHAAQAYVLELAELFLNRPVVLRRDPATVGHPGQLLAAGQDPRDGVRMLVRLFQGDFGQACGTHGPPSEADGPAGTCGRQRIRWRSPGADRGRAITRIHTSSCGVPTWSAVRAVLPSRRSRSSTPRHWTWCSPCCGRPTLRSFKSCQPRSPDRHRTPGLLPWWAVTCATRAAARRRPLPSWMGWPVRFPPALRGAGSPSWTALCGRCWRQCPPTRQRPGPSLRWPTRRTMPRCMVWCSACGRSRWCG